MGKQRWGVLLFLGSLVSLVHVSAEENYLPTPRQIQILRDQSDCSIYAAIRGRTMRRHRELLAAQAKIKQIAKQRREALGLCGAPSEASRRALQDEELALRCPTDYQEWLKAGESYLINQVELRDSYKQLQSLAGLISYQCGKVPEVPDSLPPEPASAQEPEVGSSESSTPAENPS